MSVLETEIQELNSRAKRLNSEIAEAKENLDADTDQFKADGKNYSTATVDELAAFGEKGKALDSKRDELATVNAVLQQKMGEHGAGKQDQTDRSTGGGSIAQRLLSHEAYARISEDQWLGSGAIGALPQIEVLTRDQTQARLKSGVSLFAAATDDLTNTIAIDQRLYPPIDVLRRQIRLLDLITVGATTSNVVEYAQQQTRVSAAAETDLGVAYSEASFTFTKVDANVRDIGHWTTAYRSQIADAAQFQTLVENQLQEDVLQRLESQILTGAGTGVNLRGILNFSGLQSVQRDTTNENRMDAIHRGITLVRLAFREPNAILMHPTDYQEAVFTKGTGSGLYLYPQDVRGAPAVTMWGLPVVVSPVCTLNTSVVGYWPDATLWMRSGMYLSISDSHSDYFIKRQVAVLAELRAAFSVGRPAAFCQVTQV